MAGFAVIVFMINVSSVYFMCIFAVSALILLISCRQQHVACKNISLEVAKLFSGTFWTTH